jgi:hypothetical protein
VFNIVFGPIFLFALSMGIVVAARFAALMIVQENTGGLRRGKSTISTGSVFISSYGYDALYDRHFSWLSADLRLKLRAGGLFRVGSFVEAVVAPARAIRKFKRQKALQTGFPSSAHDM